MLRLVLDPDDRVFVDVLGRAPGRGIYISPQPTVITAALGDKGLARLFRGRARGLGFVPEVPETDSERVEPGHPSVYIARLLVARAIELVALARRAGQLEVGTDTVLAALENSRAGSTLILARDLAENTARTLRDVVARRGEPRVRPFGTKLTLGEALGRGPTGVLLCQPGALADRLAAEGRRVAEASGVPKEALFDPAALRPVEDDDGEMIPTEDGEDSTRGAPQRRQARASAERPPRGSAAVETAKVSARASRCSD